MAYENRQQYAQLEYNLREQITRNYALVAQNQQLSEQLADKERKVMNDTLTSQTRKFVKPMDTNEEEVNRNNDHLITQDQLSIKPITKNIDHVPINQSQQFIEHMNMNENTVDREDNTSIDQNQRYSEQIQTNNELVTENIELQKQLEHYQREHEEQMKQMTKLLAELKEKKLDSFEAIEANDKKAKQALIQLAQQAKPIKMEGNNIALFGLTSTGKSTMLNSLLGEKKSCNRCWRNNYRSFILFW